MLTKQAKTIAQAQFERGIEYIDTFGRNRDRNIAIWYFSYLAGLRAIEISNLQWRHVLDSDGQLSSHITVTNRMTKGKRKGGRLIPIAPRLRELLVRLRRGQPSDGYILLNERGGSVRARYIVQMFLHWYAVLGYEGCNSHSGRRTFATVAAKKMAAANASIRDLQNLLGHANLSQTQRYIDVDEAVKVAVVSSIFS